MNVTFDLNIAMLFSPLVVACFIWAVNRAKDAVIRHMDINRDKTHELAEKRHMENVARFDRIEAQTTATNGKVAEHDKAITRLDAKTELLADMVLNRQPDGGK